MKEVRVAMIGAGGISQTHTIGFKTMPIFYYPAPAKVILKVICDVDEITAKSKKEAYGFEEYATDWRNVVGRDDIDLVDIITPNEFHCEIAVAAAEAGKMIYCEKPLTLSNDEAKRMCEAVEKAGVRTAVGFNKRRFPSVTFAKELISEGKIGEPIYFHGSYLQGVALDQDVPYHWRFECGPFSEIGCHSIDMARYLFGEFDEVCAVTGTYIKERPGLLGFDSVTRRMIADPDPAHRVKLTVEDFGAFMVKFKNGAMGCFEVSQLGCGKGDGCGFELYGTKGSLAWEARYGAEIKYSRYEDPIDQQGYQTVELNASHKDYFWPFAGFGVNWGDLKAIEIHDLLDAFLNDKPFSPDFNDARIVTEVCVALYESAAKGNAWIKIGS